MQRHSRRLIVGSAGSANGFGTIQSARARYGDSLFIVATDTNPRELAAASVIADAFVRTPLARSPEFPDALRALAESYPESSYLPIHDEEMEVVARLARDGGLPAGLDLIAPPYEVVRLCNDKWAMHEWLRANGLPSPETAPATPAALAAMRRPVALKPREGTGGEAVALVRDTQDLANVDPSRWPLQEQLKGPEIAIDVFLSRASGRFRCVCREYFEKRASVAMKVRLFNDPHLAGIAERLARQLPIFGACLVQVMQDAASGWRIIDVNPRIGSGTRMSAAAGLDFAAANLGDHWGEPIDELLPPLAGECYVARQYADYVTSRA